MNAPLGMTQKRVLELLRESEAAGIQGRRAAEIEDDSRMLAGESCSIHMVYASLRSLERRGYVSSRKVGRSRTFSLTTIAYGSRATPHLLRGQQR
jgi:predicted MarR family transcription regulator